MSFYNEDCIEGAKKYIKNKSIDLIICDPPFGIDETSFESMYNRESKVSSGYKEAPEDYFSFSNEWISEAKRVLKDNGTMYIFSSWNNLLEVLSAIKENNLIILNHIIWKYNFGVFTKNKFITSHYHILRIAKRKDGLTFNTYCRYGPQEKDENDKSLLNKDLEDVFYINKEYSPGEFKNVNKLPSGLINKLVLYSSNEGEVVSDFFLGNFTTAYSAIGLNRDFIGFEINSEIFDYHREKISGYDKGFLLKDLKKVRIDLPKNQGKKITKEEADTVKNRYVELTQSMKYKKYIIEQLSKEFGRGKFSITNILKKY